MPCCIKYDMDRAVKKWTTQESLGIVWMAMGETFFSPGKPMKIQLKFKNLCPLLYFPKPSSGPDWSLCQEKADGWYPVILLTLTYSYNQSCCPLLITIKNAFICFFIDFSVEACFCHWKKKKIAIYSSKYISNISIYLKISTDSNIWEKNLKLKK